MHDSASNRRDKDHETKYTTGAPLLLSPGLDAHSGAMFNNKGQAILPSSTLTATRIDRFMQASDTLIAGTLPTTHIKKESPMTTLLTTVRAGRYELANRVAMAPMTRIARSIRRHAGRTGRASTTASAPASAW